MKYWTAFPLSGLGRGYRPTGYLGSVEAERPVDFRGIFYVASGSDSKEMSSLVKAGLDICEPVMLVLVEPTMDELFALGNAVVYFAKRFAEVFAEERTSWRTKHYVPDTATLVIRPQDFDGFGAELRNKKIPKTLETNQWADGHGSRIRASWVIPEDLLFIKDGKVHEPDCSGCANVGGRVIGRCSPYFSQCGKPLFNESTLITLPPKDLYIPKQRCTTPAPFEATTPSRLDVSVSADKPIVKEPNASSIVGGETRAFRSGVCRHCIFAYKHGSSYSCFGRRCGVRRCHGPYFEGDVPSEDSISTARRYMHVDSNEILWSDFTRAERDGLFNRFSVRAPDWRTNPDLQFGYVCDDAVRITASRRGSKYYIDLTVEEMENLFQFIGRPSPELPKEPATLFERVMCHAVSCGAVNRMRLSSVAFGGGAMSLFMGGLFSSTANGHSCTVHFHHVTFNDSRSMCTIPGIGETVYPYFSYANYPMTGQRNTLIQRAFFEGKAPEKERRKFVSNYVEQAAEASKAGAPVPEFVYPYA